MGKLLKLNQVVKKVVSILTIETSNGEQVIDKIPPGPELIVNLGQTIQADQPLTNNPNVGGFGQKDTEIVLQNPARIQGLIVFFGFVIFAQVFLVLKKNNLKKFNWLK